MNRNYLALDNKLDAMESSRKDREITALTAEVASLKSQNFTTGVVQQAVSPVLGQIASLAKEVEDIKGKMPNTVPVQYPNLQVVNSTPYMGGFYGNGFGNVVF
jgi:phage terminase Nu1 subunit (DNA packaging protein)